jgi:hypothetical protein
MSRSFLLRTKNVSGQNYRKIKTRILYLVISFSKIFPFMRKCGKIFRGRQATDENMSHAHFTLDT